MSLVTNARKNDPDKDPLNTGLASASAMLPYLHQAAELINLSIPPEYLPGVVANFEQIQKIAQLVTEFPLPAAIEPAPTFKP